MTPREEIDLKRKICFCHLNSAPSSASCKRTLAAIRSHPKLKLQIVVTGMHLGQNPRPEHQRNQKNRFYRPLDRKFPAPRQLDMQSHLSPKHLQNCGRISF